MLDFEKRKEWKPPILEENRHKEEIMIRCSLCGREFLGKRWMMTTKQDVTCRDCFESTRSFYDNY